LILYYFKIFFIIGVNLLKKITKEGLKLAILLLITTNIVSFYKSKDIKTDNLQCILEKTSINGKSIKKFVNKDKPIIINFWGTWCPVCNQEVSNINKIAKDPKINLITIAVNSGTNTQIQAFLKEKSVNFYVINDSNASLAKAFNITTYPTTIFYSPNRAKIIKDTGYLSWVGYLARIKLLEQK